MKTGIELIQEERGRQLIPASSGGEGWTYEHDDTHDGGELARAAACYAAQSFRPEGLKWENHPCPRFWPWSYTEWKPSPNPIRNLVKAGALIAAEIDRIQRMPK